MENKVSRAAASQGVRFVYLNYRDLNFEMLLFCRFMLVSIPSGQMAAHPEPGSSPLSPQCCSGDSLAFILGSVRLCKEYSYVFNIKSLW